LSGLSARSVGVIEGMKMGVKVALGGRVLVAVSVKVGVGVSV